MIVVLYILDSRIEVPPMQRDRMILQQRSSLEDIVANRHQYVDNNILFKYIKAKVKPSQNGQNNGKPVAANCPKCKKYITTDQWLNNECVCGAKFDITTLEGVEKSFWCDLDITTITEDNNNEFIDDCFNTKALGDVLLNTVSDGKYRNATEFANAWIKTEPHNRMDLLLNLPWNNYQFDLKFSCYRQKQYVKKQLDIIQEQDDVKTLAILGFDTYNIQSNSPNAHRETFIYQNEEIKSSDADEGSQSDHVVTTNAVMQSSYSNQNQPMSKTIINTDSNNNNNNNSNNSSNTNTSNNNNHSHNSNNNQSADKSSNLVNAAKTSNNNKDNTDDDSSRTLSAEAPQ